MLKNLFLFTILIQFTSPYQLSSTNCPVSCTCYLYSSELTIKCTQTQEIFQLPSDFYQNPDLASTQQIIAEDCYLQSIPSNIWQYKTNLNSLNLAYNDLKTLTEENLNYLKELKYLSLRRNSLTTINNEIFKNLTNLNELNLSVNKITSISEDAFQTLKNLDWLDLSYNQISSLPKNLFSSLTELTYLDISYNSLSTINSQIFKNLENLNKLDLSYNKIKTISSEAFNSLTNLWWLLITNNQIKEITKNTFQMLINLVYLNLRGNFITSIDNEAFINLTSLHYLTLSENKLENLNSDVFKTTINIHSLDLSNNKLTFLSNDTFNSLTSLRWLYLANNRISKLPQYLFYSHLSNLLALDLSYNLLTEMELWPLYLSDIVSIDLRYNLINKFSNSFGWYVATSAYLPAFSASTIIDLQYNNISFLDDRTIQQYGVCSYNDFEIFFKKYFHVFLIDHNPVVCDCKLSQRLVSDSASLFMFLNETNIYISNCAGEITGLLNFDTCVTSIEYPYCINDTILATTAVTSKLIERQHL